MSRKEINSNGPVHKILVNFAAHRDISQTHIMRSKERKKVVQNDSIRGGTYANAKDRNQILHLLKVLPYGSLPTHSDAV